MDSFCKITGLYSCSNSKLEQKKFENKNSLHIL